MNILDRILLSRETKVLIRINEIAIKVNIILKVPEHEKEKKNVENKQENIIILLIIDRDGERNDRGSVPTAQTRNRKFKKASSFYHKATIKGIESDNQKVIALFLKRKHL